MVVAARPLTRTVGAAPAPKPQADLVNTVELVRGRVYWYKDREFKKGDVTVVDSDLADTLEGLFQIVTDRDGESYEKPFFEVKRQVPRPELKASNTTRKPIRRLSARQ